VLFSRHSGWRDGVLYPLAGGGRGIRRGACRRESTPQTPVNAAWRVGAEEIWRGAFKTCSGRLGGAAAAGRTAGEVAGGAVGRFHFSDFRVGATDDDGRRAPGAADLTGSSTTIAKNFAALTGCSLSLGAWVPKNLARRIKTCSGRLGGAAAAGRTLVRSPAAPSADSTLVIFRVGATDE